jgi:type I restriction enzyme M protein
MALKKSELYSSLWASCDELRGGMDASQYKDYVLVLDFIELRGIGECVCRAFP